MEGLVVKDADSVYVRGRSPTWLKVKNKITREARIVDMIIEDARAKTLICKMLDDGRTVRVGSDIPEGLRARMGIDPDRDRKSGEQGRSVAVRVDLGGRGSIKKTKKKNH